MKIDKTNIFIIDGLGAVLSTLCLAIIINYEKVFGIPRSYLHLFIFISSLCAIYSLGCHFLKPITWQKYLRITASFNILYAAITALAIFQHIHKLPQVGYIYFIAEALLVLLLATYELYLSTRRLASNAHSAAPNELPS